MDNPAFADLPPTAPTDRPKVRVEYIVQRHFLLTFEDMGSHPTPESVNKALPYYRKDTSAPLRVIRRTTEVVLPNARCRRMGEP